MSHEADEQKIRAHGLDPLDDRGHRMAGNDLRILDVRGLASPRAFQDPRNLWFSDLILTILRWRPGTQPDRSYETR